MSSSMDAGYALDECSKIMKTPCKKSVTKKHKWIRQNTGGASDWFKCRHCGAYAYTK